MFRKTLLAAALAFAVATPAMASNSSPLFGHASVKPMTVTQAQNVKGKGSTSLYYGFYGEYYLTQAMYYTAISQYNNGIGQAKNGQNTYYYTASQYASYASTYLYYAYYYVINGY